MRVVWVIMVGGPQHGGCMSYYGGWTSAWGLHKLLWWVDLSMSYYGGWTTAWGLYELLWWVDHSMRVVWVIMVGGQHHECCMGYYGGWTTAWGLYELLWWVDLSMSGAWVTTSVLCTLISTVCKSDVSQVIDGCSCLTIKLSYNTINTLCEVEVSYIKANCLMSGLYCWHEVTWMSTYWGLAI